jgi:hypothetical protein
VSIGGGYAARGCERRVVGDGRESHAGFTCPR